MERMKAISLYLASMIMFSALFVMNVSETEASGGFFGGGSGTAGDPYVIEDVWDLQNMTDDLGAHYVLCNDIDASVTRTWNSGAGFMPVGNNSNRFTGSLDGQNFTITRLYINRSDTNYVGILGYIGISSLVKNVNLVYLNITGNRYVGRLVGTNSGTVTNCSATGNTSGSGDVGGLVGLNWEGTVTNCYAIGNTSGSGCVGGLVGSTYFGTVTNCSTTGTTSGTGAIVGGLVGYNRDGTVTNCFATGNVSGSGENVGGLIGRNYGGVVTNCYTIGSVSGTYDNVGGLVGNNDMKGTVSNSYFDGNVSGTGNIGGLVGMNYGTVEDCYSIGRVRGITDLAGYYTGGLVGLNSGTVENCYATGSTRGVNTVGGLIGKNYGTVTNCYATGSVIRTSGINSDFGGFVGDYSRGRIINCYSIGRVIYEGATNPTNKGFAGSVNTGGKYEMAGNFWNKQTSGQTSTAGNATGKTTAEMMRRDIFEFVEWDFISIWSMIKDLTYPRLRWQDGGYPLANAGLDQTVKEGDIVVFNGTRSNDKSQIVNYTWKFEEENLVELYDGQPIYQFNNPGTFQVYLHVTNQKGNIDEDTMTVTVLDITPPIADAGPDQTVNEGDEVTFNGSGSLDNVGIVKWTWSFIDGDPITLYGIDPSYRFDTPGVYIVTFNVTDAAGHWATDMMTVTVKDITPPVANAGPDQTVDERTLVLFEGSVSYDKVGIVNYTWTFLDGDPIVLYGVDPNYQFKTPGVYIVTLNVSDAAGHWATDTMTVTVRDITAPIAVAGPDLTVDEGTIVYFDGSGSYDNVGIANHTWMFHAGEIITLYGVNPSYRFDTPGVYTVVLNVTDISGHWGVDSMIVTVLDITAPMAVAGLNRTVDEGTALTFDGGGSSDNVGIANYTWTFIDGDPILLYGVDPSYRFDTPGVYTVVLNVTDAAGLWSIDSITVTVRDITPPVADAGEDQAIEEEDTVHFDGSGSHDNVGIVNYTWSFYDGSSKVVLYGISPSHTFSIPGIYVVTLTVTDAAGNEGSDTMTVEVKEKEGNGIEDGPDDLWLFILGSIFVVVAILLIGGFLLFRRKKNGEEE